MAWHVRTALGDVVWRTEAGIPLADHRTPPDWIDDLAARFRALGMGPLRLEDHQVVAVHDFAFVLLA